MSRAKNLTLRASLTAKSCCFASLLVPLMFACSSSDEDEPMGPGPEGTATTDPSGQSSDTPTATATPTSTGNPELGGDLPIATGEPTATATPTTEPTVPTEPAPCSEDFAALKAFDCGDNDIIFEDNGPASNRVNWVILGDGYTQDILETTYREHIQNTLTGQNSSVFTQMGEPHLRYRKFINVCALKVASNQACIDNQDTGQQCDSFFNTNGDDASRLARIGNADRQKAQQLMADQLPDDVDVDWVGLTVNAGANEWWNSGGQFMLWNGAYGNRRNAASVALHEGGHSFHGLADEYGGNDCGGNRNATQPNVANDAAGAKWQAWLGFDHSAANPDGTGALGTGVQRPFLGALYCDTQYYRPSNNAEMRQLPAAHNMPSIEKIILDIYRTVKPVDENTATDATLSNPREIRVRVIDPAVLKVDWTVDGAAVTNDNPQCFNATTLAAGDHTVTAHVYDDTPWVRSDRTSLEQTLTWNVTVEAPTAPR
jgi:hypothetical protein